ncbi:hypothetical protein CBR_g34944 [Chara braunii]|uniref:Uncharacterized protein n=1 Tax=Chara braunii TaxID=69332 RepID=A0A388LJS5_CHABU|nr:hypothetical protein CBR_g34944 [Chara braunii]|eukprot:GBG82568.1 hypothetical protein CBR_g34944 [Chara braunii]
MEQQKKIAKERRKAEKKEAVECAAAERAEAELKKKKKEAKALKDAEQKEEMRKCLNIRMALRVGELCDEVREEVRQEICDAIGELCTVVARGKQKVARSGSPANSASSSDTEELNLRTRDLCLTEKRKRGPKVVLEDSPPMELPPKCTPRRARGQGYEMRRMARARAAVKTPTPKKTPPSIRKKTPAAIGVVGKLRFEKKVMNDLTNLDALVL